MSENFNNYYQRFITNHGNDTDGEGTTVNKYLSEINERHFGNLKDNGRFVLLKFTKLLLDIPALEDDHDLKEIIEILLNSF